MTRISENQMVSSLITAMQMNRQAVDKFSNEITSGIKIAEPGDSTFSGTIAELRGLSERLESYKRRVDYVQGYFTLQDDVLNQTTELLIRAKEIASQGANETNGENERLALAAEIFEMRDHMVSLANTQYQGQYIFAGTRTDQPAYSKTTNYLEGQGGGLDRYDYSGDSGTRTVNITDSLSIKMNTPGDKVFDGAIQALDRLGRALQGYRTEPATGEPDGTGTAYDLPADAAEQTQDILDCIALLDNAREIVVNPERVDVAARLKRIETAQSLIAMNKTSTKEVLGKLQDADIVESASNLSIAEQALSASMSVTARVLGISILNYL